MRPSSKVSAALSHLNSSNKTTEHAFVNNVVPVNLALPPTIHVYTSAALGPVLTNGVVHF